MSRYYKDLLFELGDTISLPRRKHFEDSPIQHHPYKICKGEVSRLVGRGYGKYPLDTTLCGEVCPWELLPYE